MSVAAGPPACDPEAASAFLRALAHPMRLRILGRLLQGELAVAGFESELGLKQPNLSQQLAALREAGLVATRREAKSVVYRLADDRIRPMLAALRLVFPDRAAPAAAAAPPSPRRQAEPASPAPAILLPATAPTSGEAGHFALAGWHLSPRPAGGWGRE